MKRSPADADVVHVSGTMCSVGTMAPSTTAPHLITTVCLPTGVSSSGRRGACLAGRQLCTLSRYIVVWSALDANRPAPANKFIQCSGNRYTDYVPPPPPPPPRRSTPPGSADAAGTSGQQALQEGAAQVVPPYRPPGASGGYGGPSPSSMFQPPPPPPPPPRDAKPGAAQVRHVPRA